MQKKASRGFFGVATYFPKRETNVGSLFRTAHLFGVDFLATIGHRYKRQATDTSHSYRHVPIFHYGDFEDFYSHIPYDCQLVGVELHQDATLLDTFKHPQRAIYLLGAEDFGIPPRIISRCHHKVRMHGERSMNVSVAGSIAIYDRIRKQGVAAT